jgi:tetratricopeptide (TPR) repeat protein
VANSDAARKVPQKLTDEREDPVRFLSPRQLLAFCLFASNSLPGQSIGDNGSKIPAQTALSVQVPAQAVPVANAALSGARDLKVLLPAGNVFGEAALLYRTGKFAAALEKYKLALQTWPNSPQAYSGMARIYLKQGNIDDAANSVSKGLALSSSDDLHVALGEIYFRRGKIPEAEREWSNVANSGSRNARAYLGLARVRNALSQHARAEAMIEKARELDAIDPDIELEWNATLPLAERIRRLEGYLESPEGAGANDRASSQHYLDYLKMLANVSGGCQLTQPRDSAEVPMIRMLADAEHVRGFGIRVSLDGRRADLMLDTGVSGILISRRFAEKAGLPKMAETRIGGVGDHGESGGYVAIANSVKIGDLEFRDCPVRVLENRSVVDEEGVIGADFFQQFLVNLDFPGQKLRLSALPKHPADELDQTTSSPTAELQDRYVAPEISSYARAYRFGSYLLIPTQLGNVGEKLFVLDTGGFMSQITPAAAREITRLRHDSGTEVTGINGLVKNVYSADNIFLRFGNLAQQSRTLASFDLSPISNAVGTEISGTLGFDLLRSLNLKIDYRDGLVDFQYAPRRWNY